MLMWAWIEISGYWLSFVQLHMSSLISVIKRNLDWVAGFSFQSLSRRKRRTQQKEILISWRKYFVGRWCEERFLLVTAMYGFPFMPFKVSSSENKRVRLTRKNEQCFFRDVLIKWANIDVGLHRGMFFIMSRFPFSTLIATVYCRTMSLSWWTIGRNSFWHTRMVGAWYWSYSRFYSWIRWWHICIRFSSKKRNTDIHLEAILFSSPKGSLRWYWNNVCSWWTSSIKCLYSTSQSV